VTSLAPHTIVDAHLHLWDPRRIRYPWLDSIPALNRPYGLADFLADAAAIPVESLVFVQCDAEPSAFEREVAWVSEQSKLDPRIGGLVAFAPLEKGRAVTADLERLKQHSILRGIRRIIQSEPDPDFCLRPDFIEGVRTLKDFDLSFDICIDWRHMANVLRFAELVPDVPLILDHIGKPPIKDGTISPWAEQLRTLAGSSNVVCKISGVATEAEHRNWTAEQLKPYIEAAIAAFGFDRILFGGDWPVSTLAIGYTQWVRLLEDMLAGVAAGDQKKFWRDNAVRVYRLNPAAASGSAHHPL
jgi:L-fuconolactonase